jgi:hypothetical protein|tara:strand:- start:4 stop:267 length:264 start_codon:yes stop_codon:yes gene_type:complete
MSAEDKFGFEPHQANFGKTGKDGEISRIEGGNNISRHDLHGLRADLERGYINFCKRTHNIHGDKVNRLHMLNTMQKMDYSRGQADFK